MRSETRIERYRNKQETSISMPMSVVTINFMFDDNLAFMIRSAACFGIQNIYVIGSIPDRKLLYPKSGSLYDFVQLRSFKNPRDFLEFAQQNNLHLIAAEIDDDAVSLHRYHFDFNLQTAIIFGNEMTGIPSELLLYSQKVFIPMPGSGFCLNTSQAATSFMTEYSRQYLCREL